MYISCLIVLQTLFSAINPRDLYSRFVGEQLRFVMLNHVAYIFSKNETKFSSLSEFEIVTTKHKKHAKDLSKILSNIGSSSGWPSKIIFTKKSKLLLG